MGSSLIVIVTAVVLLLCQQCGYNECAVTLSSGSNTINDQSGQTIPPSFPPSATYLKIGGIFDLTNGHGTPQDGGIQGAIAMQCAINLANSGISNVTNTSTKFSYHIEDSGSQAAFAMRTAQRLLDDGVVAVIGPHSSDETLSAASFFNSFMIPSISYSATATSLSSVARPGSLFRMAPSDEYQADAIFATLNLLNWTLVTGVFVDTTYGMSGYQQFTNGIIKNNIQTVCTTIITSGSTAGIANIASCLAASESNVVLLWMSTGDAANVIAQFYNTTGLSNLNFIATDGWAGLQNPVSFTGGQFPVSYLQGTLGYTFAPGDQSLYKTCLGERNPENSSDIPYFTAYWENTFNCAYVNDTSMPPCSGNISARATTTPLTCRCIGNETLDSVPTDGSVSNVGDAVFAIVNAVGQLQSNCSNIPSCNQTILTPESITNALQISSFVGSTGPVSFSLSERQSYEFQILQSNADGSTYVLAEYNGTLSLNQSLLQFKTKGIPVSMNVPIQTTYKDPAGLIFLVFVIIGLITTGWLHVFFLINRGEKIIKKASPVFCQLMLLGIDFVLISQLVWTFTQSTMTCVLKVWLLTLGFGLIMGNLLTKTYRIFLIFNNARRVVSIVLRDSDLLRFSAAIIVVEVGLLSAYSFTSGLPTPVVLQTSYDATVLYSECQVGSTLVQNGLRAALIGFNGVLIICGVIVAYVARNVDSAYNESKHIALTMYSYLLVSVILIPLYYSDAGDGSNRQFVMRSLAAIISMYMTIMVLFLPKFFGVRKKLRQARSTGTTTTTPFADRITDVTATATASSQAPRPRFYSVILRRAQVQEEAFYYRNFNPEIVSDDSGRSVSSNEEGGGGGGGGENESNGLPPTEPEQPPQ